MLHSLFCLLFISVSPESAVCQNCIWRNCKRLFNKFCSLFYSTIYSAHFYIQHECILPSNIFRICLPSLVTFFSSDAFSYDPRTCIMLFNVCTKNFIFLQNECYKNSSDGKSILINFRHRFYCNFMPINLTTSINCEQLSSANVVPSFDKPELIYLNSWSAKALIRKKKQSN